METGTNQKLMGMESMCGLMEIGMKVNGISA